MHRPQAPFQSRRRSPRSIARILFPLSLLSAPVAFAQGVLPDAPGFLVAARGASVADAWSSSRAELPQQAPAAAMPPVQVPEASVGTAQVTGIVSDIQGGLVPGAKVELENKATRIRKSTLAGSDGSFRFESLSAGDYEVYIEAPGLAKFASPVIALKPAEHYTLPDIALPVASDQSVDVFFTQHEIAQQELKAEEKQRVLGVFPNFYTSYLWDAAPLDTGQKFDLSAHAALDPVGIAIVAIRAGVQQERGTYKKLDDGPPGYGERFGIDMGNHLIGSLIGRALLPSIFHQDPRYFYMGPASSAGKRTRHALASTVMCRNDRTTRNQFCYSHLLGALSAAAVSNTYTPSDQGFAQHTFEEWGIGLGANLGSNLFREFVVKAIAAHVPKYGKGRSKDVPDQHSVK